MNLSLVIAIVSALISGLGTWAFEDARHRAAIGELRLEQANAAIQAQTIARGQEQAISRKYQEALNAATTRTAQLRTDADNARAESDRLREQSADAARRIAAAPPAAVAEYASAVSELFENCQRSYQELAAKADGHAGDVRTLMDAWPAMEKLR